MTYRALATDVDGTLTSKAHGISTGAIQAIRGLEARGVPVILASARPYPILNILREYLGTSGAIVCENGGHVDYGGESRLLGDNEECLEVYRRLREVHSDRVREAWTNRYNFVDLAIKRTSGKEKVIMGQSLYRYLVDMLDRLNVYIGMYGIFGLIKGELQWMKMMVKSFLRFLKMPKSKWFGGKKKEQKLEEE